MIRRTFSISAQNQEYEEEPNPLEMVANLSDVMLILAVALILSIVAKWGLDFANLDEDLMTLVQQEQTQTAKLDSSYVEVGTVYKNPTSGEIYLLPDKE